MLLPSRRTLSMIFEPGCFCPTMHLQFAGVADFLAVDFGDDIADLQAGFGSGRIGFDLRDDSASRGGFVEELRVLRSHVGDADADVAMADFAVANQSLHRRPDDLRRNRESHPGETCPTARSGKC